MVKRYKQLEYEERVRLALLLGAGLGVRELARELGRSPSTISRELKRNYPPSRHGHFMARNAQDKAMRRRFQQRQTAKMLQVDIQEYVRDKLQCKWSPELIAGRIKLDLPGKSISYETIYKYIYSQERTLICHLAQARKKRHSRRTLKKLRRGPPIPSRISIEMRPQTATLRKENGHWELDTMLSPKTSASALLVLVDRCSRYTRIAKLAQKSSVLVKDAVIELLRTEPASRRKTITFDNGSENAQHQLINIALNTSSFFCHPYHSWEKGTVENTISLIRRFIPRRFSIDLFSSYTIDSIEKWLNHRPRKCLNFRTPYEIFNG